MAGLVPAIYALSRGTKYVDARDKPGHDSWANPRILNLTTRNRDEMA